MLKVVLFFSQEYDNDAETLVSHLAVTIEDDDLDISKYMFSNSPDSHLARHQRPAGERHKICIASWENVDNQAPCNTNFTH